jgi:hypothetical protein
MIRARFRGPELKLGPIYRPAVFVACGARLAAHDMWIEPTAFRPQVGAVLGLKLRVGQDFLGDPLPRDPELIERFVSVDATGEKPIIGRDGGDPAGLMRLETPGLTIVAYRSRPSRVSLAAEKFNRTCRKKASNRLPRCGPRGIKPTRWRTRCSRVAQRAWSRSGRAPPPRRTGRSACRSSSSPSAIRTPFHRGRNCRFA